MKKKFCRKIFLSFFVHCQNCTLFKINFFRVEQTRFERSENRVCVTSLWKGTFSKICVQTANALSGMKETRFERSENRVRLRQNLVNHLESRDPFLPFFACLRCNEDKIWAMYTTPQALLRPFPSFFCVPSLQWRQNLVNAL